MTKVVLFNWLFGQGWQITGWVVCMAIWLLLQGSQWARPRVLQRA